jgi:Flp pilus assembly protein TadG
MLRRPLRRPLRRGASLVEFALVAPVLLLLVIGLVVAGLGVFRYQQVASLAREGARYASVRGWKYQQVTGNPAATPADVYNNAILPGSVALDPTSLGYNVTWSPDNKQGSTVSVQVTYQWLPEVFFGGVTLGSTSTVTMSY